MMETKLGDVIYENALASAADIAGWRMEGDGVCTFPMQRMRLESTRDPADGQAANVVHWCPQDLPDNVHIAWDFYALREPGLAILFFAATGRHGEDLFSPSLAPRNGPYQQYHHGDIHALHVSYFRRRYASETALHVCNLRKSFGFHMVAQGPDPLPPVDRALPPYRIAVSKYGPEVRFRINDLDIFHWHDDGETYGPLRAGGKIGFRQMAPLIAEYANLEVRAIDAL